MNKNSGFTTLELSIVLIIFSMVVGTALSAANSYNKQQNRNTTKEVIESNKTAILEYKGVNGVYPCPAVITLKPTDAKYGISDCNNTLYVESNRDVDNDGEKDWVLVGMVPFKTFIEENLEYSDFSDSNSYDGWGRKLTYVVSKKLTEHSTYNDFYGAINIIDEFSRPLIEPEGSAHVAIISHGENGKGAYTRNGDKVQLCASSFDSDGNALPEPPVGSSPSEIENCDLNDATFLSGLRAEGGNYNDDIVKYMSSPSSNLWKFVGVTDEKIQIANANSGNVGFGVDDPREALHIKGNLQAVQVRAREICDTDDVNCLPPEVLAGEVASMRCPGSNQVVKSIQNNKVECIEAFKPPKATTTPCPALHYMNGIQYNMETGETTFLCHKPAS